MMNYRIDRFLRDLRVLSSCIDAGSGRVELRGYAVLGRQHMTRRRLLGAATVSGLALLSEPAWAQTTVDLRAPRGPSTRPITTAFPQKGPMILQRTSPPWLETPFDIKAYSRPMISTM
jgi:hypothetical protein